MFRKSDILKNLFRVFLRRWVRRRISSGIRPKFDIKSNIFFLFERAWKTAAASGALFLNKALLLLNWKALLYLECHFLTIFRVVELVSPFLRLKDKDFKTELRYPLQFFTFFQTKEYMYLGWRSTENFWRCDELFFDPCLVDISLKLHGIGLKILP